MLVNSQTINFQMPSQDVISHGIHINIYAYWDLNYTYIIENWSINKIFLILH